MLLVRPTDTHAQQLFAENRLYAVWFYILYNINIPLLIPGFAYYMWYQTMCADMMVELAGYKVPEEPVRYVLLCPCEYERIPNPAVCSRDYNLSFYMPQPEPLPDEEYFADSDVNADASDSDFDSDSDNGKNSQPVALSKPTVVYPGAPSDSLIFIATVIFSYLALVVVSLMIIGLMLRNPHNTIFPAIHALVGTLTNQPNLSQMATPAWTRNWTKGKPYPRSNARELRKDYIWV